MSESQYIVSGTALRPTVEEPTLTLYSMEEYLCGLVNFEIPRSAVKSIFARRSIDITAAYENIDEKLRKLTEADLYVWIAMSPSRVTATSDSDNGWSHSGQGFTLSETDKKRYLSMANAIYEEYGEETVKAKTTIKSNSFGIMPAYRTIDGAVLPHIIPVK
jgi:hypothetical protein